jgi:hypothetical protein
VPEEKKDDEGEEVSLQESQDQEMKQDFHDTNFLLFPRRNQRVQSDEQFETF